VIFRRLLVSTMAGGVLLTWTAGSALAKCEGADPQPAFCHEIRVELSTSGGLGTYVAGRPTSFDIFQAGVRSSFDIFVALGDDAVDATSVAITFINDADGTRLRVPATATSQPGQWTAEVLLPEAGAWSPYAQVVDVNGAEYRVAIEPVHVGPPAAPPVTTPAAPSSPAVPALPAALGLIGVAVALLRGQLTTSESAARSAGTAVAS
jgi:hypothetical protein